jgi:hypothetical protein
MATSLDYQRELIDDRRALLRGLPVTSPPVKLLLYILADRVGTGNDVTIKVKTLAAEMCASVRTVQRAAREAETLDYLRVINADDYERSENTYRLMWPEIEERSIKERRRREADQARKSPRAVPTKPPRGGCQIVTPLVTDCHGGGDRIARTMVPKMVRMVSLETPSNLQTTKPLVPLVPSRENPPKDPELPSDQRRDAAVHDWYGWGVEITLAMLASRQDVQTLFEIARARDWVYESDRLRFFSVARSVRRRAEAGSISSPGGAFSRVIKRRQWGFASLEDEDQAEKAIHDLDSRTIKPDRDHSVESMVSHVAACLGTNSKSD